MRKDRGDVSCKLHGAEQAETCNLQLAPCNLYPVTRNPQPAYFNGSSNFG